MGRRQLVLVSGEPGIGTRCAEALADLAEDQGALVLWGRCREEAGGPPYWPWIQILRADGRWSHASGRVVLAQNWPSGSVPALEGNLLNFVDAPNRYGLPAFWEIHVWAWEQNPRGSYADWNTRVTCAHQPLPQ